MKVYPVFDLGGSLVCIFLNEADAKTYCDQVNDIVVRAKEAYADDIHIPWGKIEKMLQGYTFADECHYTRVKCL